ncbi:MAG TPA: T9SS type A sorting domain-containing protein, partial [Cytophagales bacterium]|nr:T9SS type A sorting domain-containing protein [Cytophagales bacterium]
HIVIKDTLSNHLDMSTLTVVSASHNVKTELSAAGVLAFHFDYIMLPDTGTNKEAAQGYVSFMIKPKADVANNTLLCNTAAIYFDQNPPIITNNACNMLVDELPNIISGLEGNTLEKVSYIYPNPAKEWIKVSEDVAMVRLFNQHGEELLHTANHNIDVAALPNGLYLMQIALNNGSVRTEKFVMMK